MFSAKCNVWDKIILPEQEEPELWELFHENSKLSLLEQGLSPAAVQARMAELAESLCYEQYPATPLPAKRTALTATIDELASRRTTPRGLTPRRLLLADLAAILHNAYGITRANQGGLFPRPFRTVPSAGALYPLELYIHTIHVEGIKAGIYHYSPGQNEIRLLKEGDQARAIALGLAQKSLAIDAAVHVFITALFQRTTFKYKERGYRFALLEAGHVAQNINLAALSLDLSVFNLGGFFDRHIDNLLGLDGIKHSTLYMLAVGQRNSVEPAQQLP